jgi:hypothetical protein
MTSPMPTPKTAMVSQRNQQVDDRKPKIDSRRDISRELLCFQQVDLQKPQVSLQHPFWGDVSLVSPCAARQALIFLDTQACAK